MAHPAARALLARRGKPAQKMTKPSPGLTLDQRRDRGVRIGSVGEDHRRPLCCCGLQRSEIQQRHPSLGCAAKKMQVPPNTHDDRAISQRIMICPECPFRIPILSGPSIVPLALATEVHRCFSPSSPTLEGWGVQPTTGCRLVPRFPVQSATVAARGWMLMLDTSSRTPPSTNSLLPLRVFWRPQCTLAQE